MAKAMTLMAQYAAYKVQRNQMTAQAKMYFLNEIRGKVVRKLMQYSLRKKEKRARYAAALKTDTGSSLQPALLKLERVGMYWASIKGRFGMRTVGAQRRVTLAVKYGNRWMNNVAVARSGAVKYAQPKPVLETNNLPLEKL